MSRDHLDQELSRALARRAAGDAREFEAQDLARFARALRRQLCEAILTESGARLVDSQESDAHDELVLQVTPLWSRRTVRVRIAARPVDQRALDRLAARVRAAGDAEGMMIAAYGLSEACMPHAIVRLVEPDELIERLQRSAWIAWPGRKPELAFPRATRAQELTQAVGSVDVVGMSWLPTLALDELPAEIADVGEAPQNLLERLAFRVLTTVFRFGGERFTASARGARLPDAVVRWPAGNAVRDAALLACVASADGYTMNADDEQRLEASIDAARDAVDADLELSFLIVLSSGFPGPRGRRHPYHARAEALAQRAGIILVYLRAVDLARLAVTVEASEMTPVAREALSWSETLSFGIPRFEDLQRLLRS